MLPGASARLVILMKSRLPSSSRFISKISFPIETNFNPISLYLKLVKFSSPPSGRRSKTEGATPRKGEGR